MRWRFQDDLIWPQGSICLALTTESRVDFCFSRGTLHYPDDIGQDTNFATKIGPHDQPGTWLEHYYIFLRGVDVARLP